MSSLTSAAGAARSQRTGNTILPPMADGRCTFSAKDLAAAHFETLLGDGVEDKAARALGAGLGWDRPPVSKELRPLFRSAKKIVEMTLDRCVWGWSGRGA